MLSGSLDDFTLPEVLRMLAALGKSGTLDVSRRAGSGRIVFRDGAVVYAETDLAKSHLGQKLVGSGKMTDLQLRQSLDVQAATGDRLGHILLVSEVISPEDLHDAIKAQIEDSAFELMCWEAGEFMWTTGEPEETDADISLQVDDLIETISARLEQRKRMQERLVTTSAVPRLSDGPPQAATINISGPQWRLLALVNGVRTVSEIARSAGSPEADARRIFLDLASVGLIEVEAAAHEIPEEPKAAPGPPAPPALEVDGELRRSSAPPRSSENGVAPAASSAPPEDDEVPDEWFEDPVSTGDRPTVSAGVAFPSSEQAAVAPEPLPPVDRAAAQRELAGLFDEPRSSRRDGPPLDPDSEPPEGSEAPPPPPRSRKSRWARRTPSD